MDLKPTILVNGSRPQIARSIVEEAEVYGLTLNQKSLEKLKKPELVSLAQSLEKAQTTFVNKIAKATKTYQQ